MVGHDHTKVFRLLRYRVPVFDTQIMKRAVKYCTVLLSWSFLTLGVVLPSVYTHAQPPQAVSDDELLVGKADRFSAVVDQAVDCLKRGDAQCFRSMLSENTIKSETRGSGAIDTIIRTRFIPFFKECARLTDTVTTLPTKDSDNDRGLAFFRTCETPSESEMPFVIYVLKKGDSYVVGNVLLNKTFEDIRGASAPKR